MNNIDNKIDVYNIMSMQDELRENYKDDQEFIHKNFLSILGNILFMIKHDTYEVEGRDSIITQWKYILTLVQCKNKIRFIQAPHYKNQGICLLKLLDDIFLQNLLKILNTNKILILLHFYININIM